MNSRSTETVEEQTQKTVTRENFRNNQDGQCTGKTEILNISDDFWHPNHPFHKYMFFRGKISVRSVLDLEVRVLDLQNGQKNTS